MRPRPATRARPGHNLGMGEQKDRMLRGEVFCYQDDELQADRQRGTTLLERFNSTGRGQTEVRLAILEELMGHIGANVDIAGPLYCEYGSQITIEDDVFINVNVMFLDVARIVVKRGAMLGPGVQLLTATHPVEAAERRKKLEQGKPITIGEEVWLGGGVIVLPGVTIGDRTTVGAGSVVTKDLPADVLAVGSPARVVRKL
jgi:maltose O-acetyltransferase